MGDFSLAAVAVDKCKTELREFPIPDLSPDAGLLRVATTGMCGADWPMYQNEKPGPRILGHEIVGTIEKLGALAGNRWGVRVGDLVALEEYLQGTSRNSGFRDEVLGACRIALWAHARVAQQPECTSGT